MYKSGLKPRNRCRCLEGCPKKSLNGYDVIKSAAIFEYGVAAIVQTEADLIQKLVSREEEPDTLINANQQVKRIICCLRDLEEKIVEKIGRYIN